MFFHLSMENRHDIVLPVNMSKNYSYSFQLLYVQSGILMNIPFLGFMKQALSPKGSSAKGLLQSSHIVLCM